MLIHIYKYYHPKNELNWSMNFLNKEKVRTCAWSDNPTGACDTWIVRSPLNGILSGIRQTPSVAKNTLTEKCFRFKMNKKNQF